MLNLPILLLKIIFLWFSIFANTLSLAEDAVGPVAADLENANKAQAAEISSKVVSDFRDPFKSWLPSKGEDVVIDEPEDSDSGHAVDDVEEEFDYSGLEVSGIVWGEAAPKAIINDQVYGIGDVVNEATIINIDKNGILWKFKNKEYLMNRGKSNIEVKRGGR